MDGDEVVVEDPKDEKTAAPAAGRGCWDVLQGLLGGVVIALAFVGLCSALRFGWRQLPTFARQDDLVYMAKMLGDTRRDLAIVDLRARGCVKAADPKADQHDPVPFGFFGFDHMPDVGPNMDGLLPR